MVFREANKEGAWSLIGESPVHCVFGNESVNKAALPQVPNVSLVAQYVQTLPKP